MQVFYTRLFQNERAILQDDEHQHCTRTLRKQLGDALHLTDGQGRLWLGRLETIGKHESAVRLEELVSEQPANPRPLHLAIAPTKNIERIEWLLEKAVEFGIERVSFLRCQRSERKEVRIDRLERIAVSAAKQSMNLHLPQLDDIQPFERFVSENTAAWTSEGARGCIGYCGEQPKTSILSEMQGAQRFVAFIGPEGDFSESEIGLATAAGLRLVHLGESRLRTETAGLAVVAWWRANF